MTRRIVLVDFYWTRDKDPRVPLGHASLYAALAARTDADIRRLAFPVNAMKRDIEGIADAVLEAAADSSPDATDVALGAYVWAEEIIQGLLPLLRRRGFTGRVILGGPQVTYAGTGLDQIYPDADLFVRGYGEDALCRLVQNVDPSQIDGVHVVGTPDVCLQSRIELDALPSPWLSGLIPLVDQPFIRWETQRGCMFRCAFCQHREAGKRLERRALNNSRLLREIDLFCESDVQEIAILDPVFNANEQGTQVLERFVERGFSGRLSLQCRAEMITDEFLDAARQLDVCLEFGLQTVHRKEQAVIRRNNAMSIVDETFRRVRALGIDFEVSLIFGLPDQTVESFEESIDWCLQRQVPVIKAFPLMLLRGTALERRRAEWRLVEDGSAMPTVISSSTFSESQWGEMARLSEALLVTEGAHPSTIAALSKLATEQQILRDRWQPG